MRDWTRIYAIAATLFASLAVGAATGFEAGDEVLPFDSDRWVLTGGARSEFLGRDALAGFAYLKDVELEDGVIEVDVAVTGARSYPGIIFRMQSQGNYERFYIRPHRAGLYPDALQYVPVFNGIAGWQLYNGTGFTAGASIPTDEWVRLRLEIGGNQARVFVGDADEPGLVIPHLSHGSVKGTVGLSGPRDGSAYFSNFRYRADDGLAFPLAVEPETPPGTITGWQVSRPFRIGEIDMERYPTGDEAARIEWREVTSEPSGLVDVARYTGRIGRETDCVLARTVLHEETETVREIRFGYSDAVTLFLNGELLFAGNSAYRLRDPSFLGIIGLNDAVYLPLKKGDNELLLMVAESFGGWGFMARDGRAVFLRDGVSRLWETADDFPTPESVLHDPERDALYVSNFDVFNVGMAPVQSISRLSMDGEILEAEWVGGVSNPSGMAIFEDRLFVVERSFVAEIEIDTGEIVERHAIPGGRLLNDIAIDSAGRIYVSDSGAGVIYRLADGEVEAWATGDEIVRPNGLHVDGDRLIVGNNGDSRLKSVDLADGTIRTIARLGPGVIDGIETDSDGNYLVSLVEGKLYRVDSSGELSKLVDTTGPGGYIANFDYVPENGLVVVPTYTDNRIVTYRLPE
jgi:sugar lactone lactonase YvrE